MLTLINTNTMQPAIAPVGLDYIAGAAKKGGIEVDLVDLCLTENRDATLRDISANTIPNSSGYLFATSMTASGQAASGLFRDWPNR